MNDPSAYRAARDRGCDYLLRHCRPDGGVGSEPRGVADYYKVTSAFQVCGETSAASRLCQWIRRHGITPEGDFAPRPPEAAGYPYAYFNSWVVLGAHRLGQYDLAHRGMDFPRARSVLRSNIVTGGAAGTVRPSWHTTASVECVG